MRKDHKSRTEMFDNLKYIFTNCPICGNDNYKQLIRFGYHQKFTYVRCKICSTIYANPKFFYDNNFINIAYGDDFHLHQKFMNKWNKNINGFIENTLKSNVIKFRFKVIEEYVKSGNLLDIGCATGGYLIYGNKHGWKTFGTEICKPMYELCKNILKLNVFNKQLKDIKFKSNKFDAITLFHVIEHFEKPLEALKEIYRILKPHGIALIETPNCDALDTIVKRLLIKLKLKVWDMPKGRVPGHFFEFNLKSFKYACKKLNYKIIYAHTYSSKKHTDRLNLRHFLNLGTKYRFIIQK